MSIISAIKVPNAFVFNLQEIENVTPIRKDATFCEVKLFRYREARYAFKVIHKSQIPSERFEEEYKRVVNEIRILYQLNHPYIVKLFFHEETEEEIRLLMDYGGTRLRAHFKNTYQNEEEVKKIVKQILEALKYLHDEGFIHRDLEPENILLNKQEQTIKLIDFGFIDEVAFRRTKIGSFHYMAPEITGDHNYNQKVDIWSLGIIVYEMLHQDLPFCSRKEFDEEEFEHNKRNLRIEFDNQISEQAIHFIKKMLVLDPESRASASELLRHEFISPEDDLSMFDREGT
jgi:serine/threonine kinase 33